MENQLRTKLLNVKKKMLQDLEEAWDIVVGLNISERRVYRYEGIVDSILKYYRLLFQEDLCKYSPSGEQILDIKQVIEAIQKVNKDIKEGRS